MVIKINRLIYKKIPAWYLVLSKYPMYGSHNEESTFLSILLNTYYLLNAVQDTSRDLTYPHKNLKVKYHYHSVFQLRKWGGGKIN